jgi:hypothetical protein
MNDVAGLLSRSGMQFIGGFADVWESNGAGSSDDRRIPQEFPAGKHS